MEPSKPFAPCTHALRTFTMVARMGDNWVATRWTSAVETPWKRRVGICLCGAGCVWWGGRVMRQHDGDKK